MFKYLSRNMLFALASALLIGAGAFTWLILGDPSGDAANLWAELGGVTVSFVVAVVIVEWYLKQLRQRRWERVRSLTYRALAAHLSEIGTHTQLAFGIGLGQTKSQHDKDISRHLGDGRDKPHPPMAAALRSMAQFIRSHKDPDYPRSSGHFSVWLQNFRERARWDLNQIRDVLFPRIVDSAADQDLIDRMAELDERRRNLEHQWAVHEDVMAGDIQSAMAGLLEASADLYDAVCERWEGESGS